MMTRLASAGLILFATIATASHADVLRAIAQDARSGEITDAQASVLALRAVAERNTLPEKYASLEYVPPRCATPILKAAKSALDSLDDAARAETESLLRGFFPCNNAGFQFSLTSATHPVTVHYETGIDAVNATNALRFLEEAWDYQVDELGFTAPLLDGGGCGIDSTIDLYLDRGSGTAYTLDVSPNNATSWDDFSTFMVIDPVTFGGNFLETTVHHEFNHAIQAADDWWEVGAAFEATSTLVEEFVDDSIDYYADTIEDFNALTRRPFEHNDDYATFFMYGASLQLLFYSERYFADDPGFLAEYWQGNRSLARGCYCQGVRNNPDSLDSLANVLRSRAGVSYEDALIEFSRWRWFVGSNDDGAHFSEGASWPESAQIDPVRSLVTSSLPSNVTINNGPYPNGVSYVIIENNAGTEGPLCVTFSNTTGFGAHVETLSVGTGGEWFEHDVSADNEFGVDMTGVQTLVVMVLNIADGEYDPDFIPNQSARFSLGFESPGTCEIASVCLGDCDNSGAVDFADLVAMLFAFRGTDETACDADGSGAVNFADLVAALFEFGPCD